MYFMLGNIAFEPVNLTEFSEQHTTEFARTRCAKRQTSFTSDGRKAK